MTVSIVPTKPTATPPSILDAVVHARLLQDLDHICLTANIPPLYLHQSMAVHCSASEMEWVQNYPLHRLSTLGGLCLTGKNSESRCMAICAALLRNFIDARVVTLNQLVESAGKPDTQSPSVLIVPNLYVTTHGKSLTSWQIQSLYDILLSRYTTNRPTVVYIEDKQGVLNAYGSLLYEHLEQHFRHVG